jgi:outer membrane protein OmpA-like peptidoglycan-associated protein
MATFLRHSTRLAATAAFALLAGCAQMNRPAPPPATAYNPPNPALATTPADQITRFRVAFATGSTQIDADGAIAVANVANLMQTNPALIATLIGAADGVGSDASNMLLSKQRATAVHNALLQTGKVPEQRIETRWIGERGPAPINAADANYRAVEIAVH